MNARVAPGDEPGASGSLGGDHPRAGQRNTEADERELGPDGLVSAIRDALAFALTLETSRHRASESAGRAVATEVPTPIFDRD